MSDLADKTMKLVSAPDYKPMSLKAIAKQLGLGADEYPEFRSEVKGLIKEGRLEVSKDKKLRKPSTKGTVIGVFRRTSKGFGFVRPHKSTEKSDQIYIPTAGTRDASTGDEVVVKVTKRPKSPGMNPEGRVIQVLVRASGVFVGTYYEDSGSGYVRVDGTAIHAPIYVGDPGAKGAKPGDKVALEMVRYPSPALEGEGVLTEIFGPRGKPGVDTLTIIRSFNIPDVFDDEVLEEARRVAKHFNEEDVSGRRDLRETLTVTIDPATARDFDDAITLTRDEKGFWQLGVHIADVSHFVRADSHLDRTARLRGTSVYLADRVIPMLPEVLSNSLASLQAGRTRYTLSAFLEFNPDGIRTDRGFARSAIRVDHRFSYEEAFAVMKAPEAEHPGVKPEVARMLGAMLELAMILRRRRFERGALELNMPEIEIDLDDQGKVAGAHLASNDESHQVIEEFMLAANEAVASLLTDKHVGFLRRAHADPDPTKLVDFAEFVGSLGLHIENPSSRFELQRILAETAGKPEEHAVHYAMLRSLKQAVYTPEHEGHYALASENYCHFTSPIRRYPDLQVHRQLTTLLEDKRPKSDHDELMVLAENCTRTERRAETAERELLKIKLLSFLEGHVGDPFHAVIIGVEDFGLFCRLVELPIDGLLHITSLPDDYYYLEAGTHTLVGRRSGRRYRLGDRVEVRIARIDVDRRELDLVSIDAPPGAERPPRARSTDTTASKSRPAGSRSARTPASSKGKGRSPKGKRRKKS